MAQEQKYLDKIPPAVSNTPELSPMDKGHKQPDSPEVSSRET